MDEGQGVGAMQKILNAINAELLAACERVLAAPCPRDTNGDGDCGQHSCPWCGKEIREAVAKAKA
jgi:hypothetical protein